MRQRFSGASVFGKYRRYFTLLWRNLSVIYFVAELPEEIMLPNLLPKAFDFSHFIEIDVKKKEKKKTISKIGKI